jgi:molybdate transport system substrate-binding protein
MQPTGLPIDMRRLIAAALLLWIGAAEAAELRIAVASNFMVAAQALAERFEADSGHTLKLSFASTGKQFAQIRHGAPYDLFLAADRLRPEALEQAGLIVPGSRFTYALGELVLWSPDPQRVDREGAVLQGGEFRYLSLANARLAPYGRAAAELIAALGLESQLKGRMVRGESVGQAFQFVSSGNAELGLVAYAQVKGRPGSLWRVPESLYSPIEQQAVALNERPETAAFARFLRSYAALEIIRNNGYRIP